MRRNEWEATHDWVFLCETIEKKGNHNFSLPFIARYMYMIDRIAKSMSDIYPDTYRVFAPSKPYNGIINIPHTPSSLSHPGERTLLVVYNNWIDIMSCDSEEVLKKIRKRILYGNDTAFPRENIEEVEGYSDLFCITDNDSFSSYMEDDLLVGANIIGYFCDDGQKEDSYEL